MKYLTFIIDDTVKATVEDLFKGGYSAHKVADLVETYAIIKSEDKLGSQTINPK